MATYNGEKYLRTQLDSILNQVDCEVEIYVGDNGSTDNTLEILDSYLDKKQVSKISNVTKKGHSFVFLNLVQAAGPMKFIAFADQDDVWDSNKLSKQITKFDDEMKPTLIFSSRKFIDSQGAAININSPEIHKFGWRNAVIQNVIPGNTMVLNASAVSLLKILGEVDVKHYDSWIYLVMSVFGQIHFVPEELVSYRLHETNTVGVRKRADLLKFLRGIHEYIYQVKRLGEAIEDHQELCPPQDFVDFIGRLSSKNIFIRISSIYCARLYRQSKLETFLFRIGMIPFLLSSK